MQFSVIFPAYEEGPNLRANLPKIISIIKKLDVSFEILVVDTVTAKDDTPEICRQHPSVRYMNRAGGNDYGDAIRTGIQASTGDYIVIMDADSSHDPNFIPKMWGERNNADCIIASRYIAGGTTDNSLPLYLMSRILNWTYRLYLNIPAADVSNSFRLYNGNQLRSLHLTSSHFDIVEEILIKLFIAYPNMRLLEIPSSFHRRNQGKTKRNLLTFIFSYLKTMRKLKSFQVRAKHATLKQSAF